MHISSRMSAGRAFHADGPEKENALSPNFVRRHGTSYRPLSVDRRRLVDLAEVGSTMSARYTGDSRHSLYCILQRMGSQCSWIRLAVMWSDVRRPKISRAAAVKILHSPCLYVYTTNMYVMLHNCMLSEWNISCVDCTTAVYDTS